MSKITFDVRLSQDQIDMIEFALRQSMRAYEQNDEIYWEINALIDMFDDVQENVLNSFVD